MNAALKIVLGNDVHQKGSNITEERMRFDFSYDTKMTPEQIKTVEDLVNDYIKMAIDVKILEMSKEEALETRAEAMFLDKYGDIRTNYFRDIDRIIHSLSYTRYIDKTQVFTFNNNDHISKRIIHVQLVSKIARTIGRA